MRHLVDVNAKGSPVRVNSSPGCGLGASPPQKDHMRMAISMHELGEDLRSGRP